MLLMTVCAYYSVSNVL